MESSTNTPAKSRRGSRQPRGRRNTGSHLPKPAGVPTQITNDSRQQLIDQSSYTSENPPTMSGPTSTPITPPRPRSMYEGAYNGQLGGHHSASDTNDKRRRKSQKLQSPRTGHNISNSKSRETPRSRSQKNLQTPDKPSVTPPQAYAGPTFHASPAPSSLPIPKFFKKSLSKSVPEMTQAKTLSRMVENDVSEEAPSPGSSEASPVREKAERLQQHRREDSPLDVFFRADREEKARARLANITNTRNINATELATEPDSVHESSSPGLDVPRHHSRQHTGNSLGGLFPMDLEQDNPPAQIQPSDPSPAIEGPEDFSHTDSAPSASMNDADRDDEARRSARSAELMKLLGTVKPRLPTSPSPKVKPVAAAGSPRSSMPPTRESTGPFATTRKPDPPRQILSRKQPASLPELQHHFGVSNSSKQCQRARPSSSLRQEVPAPASPVPDGLPELPATSNPSSTVDLSAMSQRVQSTMPKQTAFPLQPTTSPASKSFEAQNPNFSSMENDLRRILRLDFMGGESTKGV